jgi:rhamnose transport system ATP-binding protein
VADDQAKPRLGGIILRIDGLTKHFGGVQALEKVSIEVRAGATHALVGENGAGKSTLIKILAGNLRADRGVINFKDREFAPRNPAQARSNGVSVIYQELTVIPDLSVAENIFLGTLPTAVRGFVDWRGLMDGARAILNKLGLDIDPAMRAGDLAIGLQQMVEIAKSLAARTDLLIMDEPTSSLSHREIARLWGVVRDMRASGKTIIFVTHKLDEVFAIADQITVLRDGRHVLTCDIAAIDSDRLVASMVGHELSYAKKTPTHALGEELLIVNGLNRQGRYADINFSVRAGEIVGLAGLVGAGRTDVVRSIFGADRADSGAIKLGGRELRLGDPRQAIVAGIGFVPENRKEQALFLQLSVLENLALPDAGVSHLGVIDRRAESSRASEALRRFRIVAASVRDDVVQLSGGNQQKVVLARWLALRPRILIVDEPTRGIDVGAKAEIHELLREFARQGLAVVLVSSELPEILALSDRIFVMRAGRIVADLAARDATEESIAGFAVGAAV